MTAFAILTAVILAAAYTVTAVTCWAEDNARTTARRQAPETTGEIA